MLSEIGLTFPNPLENINDRNHQIKKNNYRIFFHEISSTTQKKNRWGSQKSSSIDSTPSLGHPDLNPEARPVHHQTYH